MVPIHQDRISNIDCVNMYIRSPHYTRHIVIICADTSNILSQIPFISNSIKSDKTLEDNKKLITRTTKMKFK